MGTEEYTTQALYFLQMHEERTLRPRGVSVEKRWFHCQKSSHAPREFERYLKDLLAGTTPEKIPKRLANFLEVQSLMRTEVRTKRCMWRRRSL